EPGILGPSREIFGEVLGERDDILLRRTGRSQALLHALAGARDDRPRRVRESDCERGDVRRRARAAIPAVRTLGEPLAGERRLAVTGRSDEHEDPGRALVQQACQPRALDDALAPGFRRKLVVVLHLASAGLPARGTIVPIATNIERGRACGQRSTTGTARLRSANSRGSTEALR